MFLFLQDYNNILHDLSDLQRADRERRLRVVHNIPVSSLHGAYKIKKETCYILS